MNIRFGVSPIAWINDDMPELGGDTSVESVIQDARRIGFSGIELGGKFPRHHTTLAALLGRGQLKLAGGWYSGQLLVRSVREEIAALQSHLALLKAMDCNVFIHAETSNAIHSAPAQALTATPRLDEQGWVQFGARLTELAEYIASEGLKFAYHHHLGTVVQSAEDLEQLVKHTGSVVGFTLDTGHAALGGIDARAVIRQHRERIAHVHCKDVRPEIFQRTLHDGGSFLDGVLAGMFTVPGDGALDFDAVMKALAEIDYSGWIIIEAEQDPAKADPCEYAQIGLRTLRRSATAAGFSVEECRT